MVHRQQPHSSNSSTECQGSSSFPFHNFPSSLSRFPFLRLPLLLVLMRQWPTHLDEDIRGQAGDGAVALGPVGGSHTQGGTEQCAWSSGGG